MLEDKTFDQLLQDRQALSKEYVNQGHFLECYLVAYPDDSDVYCTCHKNSVPDE